MVSNEDDLQALLIRLDRRYDRVDDGTFLVSMGGGQAPVALRLAPPVLVAQVEVGPAPKGQGIESNVFRMLLEKNGLDGEHIMLSAALELESLDMNELEAVLADMGMALSEHVPTLKAMIEKKG